MIEAAIKYPVTVAVAVLIATLGGVLALFDVPIQLTPEIERPQVTVATNWFGASPEEIEREIIEEQEDVLKSVEGVTLMRSESYDGYGQVILEFAAGTDLTAATVRVSNKLDEVLAYPRNADRPVVSTVGRFDRSIAWFVIRSEDNIEVAHQATFIEDEVKPRLERVSGVAGINLFGGLEQEVHVIFDPDLLASIGITVGELAVSLREESQDISAGDFSEGKRRYVVRTMGRYRSLDDVAQTVIRVREGVPIRVGDVAEVTLGHQKPTALVRFQGDSAVALNAQRQIGSNVLEVTEQLVAEITKINEQLLEPRGMSIAIAYQENHYIEASIERVLDNIFLGGLLAVAVLFFFLRSPSSVLVVALSIPISVVTTFLSMKLMGRTINVISLAGMAFAVGMVVDNAIVVLENIYRHQQMGKRRFQAARDGAREVWGAVLASTLTTVAVFLPIVFIEERAGQLFRDIALAISSAIVVSLVVAVTVIPSASARMLRVAQPKDDAEETFLARLARRISTAVDWINSGRVRRLAVMTLLVVLSVGLTLVLLPSAEYLPNGNQNFLFGVLLPPPGYNLDEVLAVGDELEAKIGHLWKASDEDAVDLPGGGARNFWYVALRELAFMGVEARDPSRAHELVPAMNQAMAEIPGAIGFANQQSLFTDDIAGTRSLRIDVTGPQLEEVLALATQVFGQVGQVLPGSSSRPIPGLDLGSPEVRIFPDRVRAADAGFGTAEIGNTVNALVDGSKVAEYFHQGREIDLVLKGGDAWTRHTQSVAQLPLATPTGQIVTLGDIATVEQRQGAVQINHVERRRAVSIETALPGELPLEQAIASIEGEILDPLRAEGRIGGVYDIFLRGAADDLSRLRSALGLNFVVVVALTYLLLAALFQSFLYPLVILVTVPLATFGGVLGLRLVQVFDSNQQLDILTMLGFVILVGTVINNSILIVYQGLQGVREGSSVQAAVREAVRVRVRPILMSTLTSSLGMLPLVLMPGAGSELYRGLGAVVVGGLLVSTGITLFLTPLVFTFALELRDAVARRLGLGVEAETADATAGG